MSYVSTPSSGGGGGSGTVTSVTAGPGISITGNPAINPTINNTRFPITPYVVGPVGNAGYQTIQSAMDAANAAGGGSVYIQTGAYTENLTFYPDVQLVGVTGNSDETAVGTDITIAGQHTPADTGYTTISNIYLTNTSDIFFSTDAGSCVIALQNCNVAISGAGYTFNLANWTGQLNKYDVQDNSVANGVVNNTGGAPCFFENSNMGAGTSNSMITTGNVTMNRIDLTCPWDAQAGTIVIADFATFESTVTVEESAGGAFYFCRFTPNFNSGGAALIWNSSTILEINNCIMDSTATYTIDGSGTGDLILGAIDFVEGTGINPALTGIVSLGGFLPGSFGTTGQVFTSNGPFVVPSFQNAGGGGSVTIDGDTGSATGSTITFNGLPQAGSTVSFSASGSTVLLNTSDMLGNENTLIGSGAGNSTVVSAGGSNTALGSNALGSLGAVNFNTAIGTDAGAFNSGSGNIFIGSNTGQNYTGSESYNVLLGSFSYGTLGESNVLHIGAGTGTDPGELNSAFISGINGITVADADQLLVIDASDNVGAIASSTSGYVLTSNGPGVNPSWQAAGGGGGITTIDGDSGSVTGSTVSIQAGVSTNNCGSTVHFVNSGTTSTLNVSVLNSSNSLYNTAIGINAGALLSLQGSAFFNTAIGDNALASSVDDNANIAIGSSSCKSTNGSSANVSIGAYAMASLTADNGNNVAIGSAALTSYGSAGGSFGNNTAIGANALGGYQGGTDLGNCVAIGSDSGFRWFSGVETNNIAIGTSVSGITGETNAIHIGDGIGITSCYIGGINGITVTGAAVLVSAGDQLGVAVSSRKYKDNIADMDDYSSKIHNLRPVTFNYNVGQDHSLQAGLIAEEVHEVMPELVVYDKFGEPQTVSYHNLPALLLNEVQKLRKELDELKASK